MTAAALAIEPPANVEAEETVLGAILLAGAEGNPAIVDRVRETGLQPIHFYRESHGRLYLLLVERHDLGEALDPLTVAAHLPEGLEAARVHELAQIVPAVGLAPSHARLVVDAYRRRQMFVLAQRLEKASLNGGVTTELAADLQAALDTPTGRTVNLEPLWLAQALTEAIPETSEYVEGVLEAGVLADIVGLPYLHKSAAALELSVKVAKGRGLFLGRFAIKAQAKVAYFWADDSRPQELKRIQAYAEANNLTDQPVGFYLNPGILIPEDLPFVRQQILKHGFRMAVFDSLYNFADFDFVKDTGKVKDLYRQLKRLCDEVEGLTIVLVDHASKPSDSNRDRDDSISSFGSVWKAAAVRCSIVVSKTKSSLFVSGTGNNVKGFPKTPAYFNQERLELSLADEKEVDEHREEDIEERVVEYVRRQPGKSSNQIRQNVKGRNADIDAAIARLADKNMICDTYKSSPQLLGANRGEVSEHDYESSPQDPGAKKRKTAWIPLNQAEKVRPNDAGRTPGEPRPGTGSSDPSDLAPKLPLYVVEGSLGESEGEPKEHILMGAPEAQPGYDPEDW